MLIFQSEKLSTVGFQFVAGTWRKQFTLERGSYRLRKAFGAILIGVSQKDHTLKLLELGGKMDNTIVTEMALGLLNSPDFYLDAKQDNSNQILIYQREFRTFTWKKFERQNQLCHMPKDTITQVCDNYKIQIKLKSRKIFFYSLKSMGDTNELNFSIELPRHSKKSKIDFFTPVINKSKTKIVLAMSYGQAEGWTDDKYHCLILVDLVQKRAFQNDGM